MLNDDRNFGHKSKTQSADYLQMTLTINLRRNDNSVINCNAELKLASVLTVCLIYNHLRPFSFTM